jgi:hypothetical protein
VRPWVQAPVPPKNLKIKIKTEVLGTWNLHSPALCSLWVNCQVVPLSTLGVSLTGPPSVSWLWCTPSQHRSFAPAVQFLPHSQLFLVFSPPPISVAFSAHWPKPTFLQGNKQIKAELDQAPVTYACNPRDSGGRDQEDHDSKPTQANSSWDPISKNPSQKKRLMEWLKG